GIDAHLAVIHPAIALVRQELPGLAAVVGTPDAALLRVGWRSRLIAASATAASARARLHERAVVVDARAGAAAWTDFNRHVNRRRFGARDVDPDAADERIVRQAVAGQPRPGLRAVRRLPQTTARSTAIESPRLTPP